MAIRVSDNQNKSVGMAARLNARRVKAPSSLEALLKNKPIVPLTIVDLIKNTFKNIAKIAFVDLDTGLGDFVTNFGNLLEQHFSRVDRLGIDTLHAIVRQATAKGHPVVWGMPGLGDYQKAGLRDASYDIVTINNIESAVDNLMEEADRIVKPGGLIIVTFEINDILEEREIDRQVERTLKQKGYYLAEVPFPADYPHTANVNWREAAFIIIAQKPIGETCHDK